MSRFLLFTLYAPLSSWGEIAVGELRNSWDRPGRSAILGLVAAALGIRRDDSAQHSALDRSVGVAVRLDARGTPMTDYHTAQTASASSVKNRRPRTRAELLQAPVLETMLSRRSYRADAVSTVGLWIANESEWTIESIANALRYPVFPLYAGRKGNCLGLPLNPAIVEAETLAKAFEARPAKESVPREIRRAVAFERAPEIAWDDDRGVSSGLVAVRREVRRDASPDRARWLFAERVVTVASAPASAEGDL